jgi:hypothetical protein
MKQLILKTAPSRKDEHFSNLLLLIQLKPWSKHNHHTIPV